MTLPDQWTGEDVSVREIERQLGALRTPSEHDGQGPDLRTSVMTHMAWVPEEWLEAASETLEGLAERHPSRTIVLVPDPDGPDRLDASVSSRCFPLEGQERHVSTEVIYLRLGGGRAQAPASVVQSLLIADLPVFLRWRGRPPFESGVFDQLIDVVDRLVLDSAEWQDVPAAYRELDRVFDLAAVSDIAWSRLLEWRRSLAALWPGIGEVRQLRVAGPPADSLLLAGWLRARLRSEFEFVHDDSDALELVAVDGEAVAPPRGERSTPSDLLSDELDNFSRDPIYEEAVRATA